MDMSQIMWLIPGKNIIIQVAFENFESSHIVNKHHETFLQQLLVFLLYMQKY